VPRGWEDYWGRVRRVQYPTVIDAKKEATTYRTDSAWYTHRTYEADLEFNLPTPYLQVHVIWTIQVHSLRSWTATRVGYGRIQVYWNDTLVATGPEKIAGITDPAAACVTTTYTQDVKVDCVLDKKYWRGIVKVEFQLYSEYPADIEIRISSHLCKAEVGPYQW